MSSSNDTSAIDEKQEELNSSIKKEFYSNVKSFLIYIVIFIIVMTLCIFNGGLMLYACKVAQSNILPTDINSTPYTEIKPNIQPIETNIFPTDTNPPLSMKLSFPYNDYNASNTILDMIREYKNNPDSNFLLNYFFSIVESSINMNYKVLNTILNMFNENFSESVIIMLLPFLSGIIISILFLYNEVYVIYLWFANMSWFFKTNKNDTGSGKPEWNGISITSPIKFGIAVCLVITFSWILFFMWIPILLCTASATLLWCIFSPIMYEGKMNNKTVNAMSIIQGIFVNYKIPIMIIFSFAVIILAFLNLGTTSGIFSIVTLLLIYFGFMPINMFNPIINENLSPLVSDKQAKKPSNNSSKNSSSFFSGWFPPFFGGSQSGGNITKELKKISEKLKISKTI